MIKPYKDWIFYCLLLFCSCPYLIKAQTETQDFFHFTQENGLSNDFIISFLEDHEGFIWIGTENGLNRYDGHRFLVFKDDPQDPGSIQGNFVWSIFEDNNHNLWLGTDRGLGILDRTTGTFRKIALPDEEEGKSYLVFALCMDQYGNMWAGTVASGLFRLSPKGNDKDWDIQHFTHNPDDPEHSVSKGRIVNLIEDGEYLWVGTSSKLDRLHIKSQAWEKVIPGVCMADEFNSEDLKNLTLERPGVVLFATFYSGVFRIQSQEGESAFECENIVPPFDAKIKGLALNGTEGLWLTSENGLFFYHFEQKRVTHWEHDPGRSKSLSFNRVRAILKDDLGNLWLGTDGYGGSLLKKGHPAFDYYTPHPENPFSITNSQVRSMLVDRKGFLWVGMLNGGLDKLKRNEAGRWEKIQSWRHDPNDPSSLLGDDVIKIIEDRKGNIWIGTNGDGLNCLNPSTNELRAYVHEAGNSETLLHNRIWALCEDQEGYIWAGTFANGLNRLDPQTGKVRRYTAGQSLSDSLSTNLIRNLYVDQKGSLWIGTENGLNKYDQQTDRFATFLHQPDDTTSLSSSWIWSIFQDSRGFFWIGTNLGLNRMDPRTGQFERFYEEDGLPSNAIYGILEDDLGNIWISTDDGLARFYGKESLGSGKQFRAYGSEDGLNGDAFLPHSYFKDQQNGQLYFGGLHGFNIIHPQLVSLDTTPPPMLLSAFERFHQNQNFGRTEIDPFIHHKEHLSLSHLDDVINFTFTDLSYGIKAANYFEYQLEGLSDQWIPLESNYSMTFIDLAPGSYTLKMRGNNADGVAIESRTMLRFYIQPPWWASWWALLVYGIIGVLVIYGLRQSERNRQLLRQKAEVQRARAEEKHRQAETVEAQAKELERSLRALHKKNEEILDAQNKLVLQEKMASLGQITAGIAHEIKNPLNFVTNFAEGTAELLDELEQLVLEIAAKLEPKKVDDFRALIGELKQNAQDIRENGRRADRIVFSMMQHARGDKGTVQLMDLNALVEENVNLAYHGYRAIEPAFSVHIETALDAELPKVTLIPQEVGRVLLNILNNACYALHQKQQKLGLEFKSKLVVKTESNSQEVLVRIRDNGPGIPPSVRQKIFNPFYTTKPTGTGNTGLGLSISYDIIVKGHQGRLEVESEPNEFTEFLIALPK